MIIGIDWVIVCDLVSLIGGVVIGVALAKPSHFLGPRNR
jgi:hypothetical protein